MTGWGAFFRFLVDLGLPILLNLWTRYKEGGKKDVEAIRDFAEAVATGRDSDADRMFSDLLLRRAAEKKNVVS